MRIAHVVADLGYGGAERMLVDLAVSHAADGYREAIISAPGELDRDWEALGISRFRFARPERRPIGLVHAARAVRAAIAGFEPDVIHSHNVKATALVGAAIRFGSPRVPLVATLHGVARQEMWFSARILRLADQIAAVSTSLREAVVEKGLDPGRVEVIHNGVSDPPPLSGAQRATYDRELGLSGTVVAAVGRLVPLKAHDRFIEAAKIVLERGAHATFLLVGDGPERTDLEALVAKLGVSASVRLLGERDDARALIDRADLVVFSSDREGHSIAALEALAAGTPVVSTDVSGMRELLDGGAGTIVDSWTPAALADAISALINDSERRRAMGDAGRRLVAERFSAERMRARYAEIYARLAGT